MQFRPDPAFHVVFADVPEFVHLCENYLKESDHIMVSSLRVETGEIMEQSLR